MQTIDAYRFQDVHERLRSMSSPSLILLVVIPLRLTTQDRPEDRQAVERELEKRFCGTGLLADHALLLLDGSGKDLPAIRSRGPKGDEPSDFSQAIQWQDVLPEGSFSLKPGLTLPTAELLLLSPALPEPGFGLHVKTESVSDCLDVCEVALREILEAEPQARILVDRLNDVRNAKSQLEDVKNEARDREAEFQRVQIRHALDTESTDAAASLGDLGNRASELSSALPTMDARTITEEFVDLCRVARKHTKKGMNHLAGLRVHTTRLIDIGMELRIAAGPDDLRKVARKSLEHKENVDIKAIDHDPKAWLDAFLENRIAEAGNLLSEIARDSKNATTKLNHEHQDSGTNFRELDRQYRKLKQDSQQRANDLTQRQQEVTRELQSLWPEVLDTQHTMAINVLFAVEQMCRDGVPFENLPYERQRSGEVRDNKRRSVVSSPITWDPSRMIGWRIHHASKLNRTEFSELDLWGHAMEVMRTRVSGGVPQTFRKPEDVPATGESFTDYVHHIVATANCTQHEAACELLTMLGMRICEELTEYASGGPLRGDEVESIGEATLRELGWEEQGQPEKVLAKLECMPYISPEDLRKTTENVCKDLLLVAASRLPDNLNELVSVLGLSDRRELQEKWEKMMLGEAVIFLSDLLLRVSFPKDGVSELCGVIREIGTITNYLLHDQVSSPNRRAAPVEAPSQEEIKKAAFDLLDVLERHFEMPWHLRVVSVVGRGPRMLQCEGWRHTCVNSRRVVRVLDMVGRDDEEILVLNPTGRNPTITSGQFLEQP